MEDFTTTIPAVDPTKPPPGLTMDEIIVIIVAATAGALFILVLVLMCIVVWLYYRKIRQVEKPSTPKIFNNRHPLFREPSKREPHKFADLEELNQAVIWSELRRSSRRSSMRSSIRSSKFGSRSSRRSSRRSSIRNNPTFGKEEYDAVDLTGRTQRPRPFSQVYAPTIISATVGNSRKSSDVGIDNPAANIHDSKPSSEKEGVSRSNSANSRGSNKIDILRMNSTWSQSNPAENDDIQDTSAADDRVNTISGADDHDPTFDMFSPFQRSNAEQRSRRSFKSRNSAVIDLYEGGGVSSGGNRGIGMRTTNSVAMDDPYWAGDGKDGTAGRKMLWQKKVIF